VTNDYNPFPGNSQAATNLGTDFVGIFTPYLVKLNAYRCSVARRNRIPCADVARAFNGPDEDRSAFAKGLIGRDRFAHPSAKGHRVIAQRFARSATGRSVEAQDGRRPHASTPTRGVATADVSLAIPSRLRLRRDLPHVRVRPGRALRDSSP
jgi:hypothetical protein